MALDADRPDSDPDLNLDSDLGSCSDLGPDLGSGPDLSLYLGPNSGPDSDSDSDSDSDPDSSPDSNSDSDPDSDSHLDPDSDSDHARRNRLKLTPFSIRVTICFLLSLIPIPELENRIYSARLSFSTHPALYEAPYIVLMLITISMIILGALVIIYYPVLTSAVAITASGVIIIIFGFQLILQVFHLYIPSAEMISALLVTYLVFTGYRLALQENLQWRSLKQAEYLLELDQMKTNFLSLVSHDLKTPIAKIQAMLERMRREVRDHSQEKSDWKEMIDSIENSNNEMKRYITSILNLSKLESQKVILNKKSNDMNRIIQNASRRLKPLAQQKNIEVIEGLEPLFSIECDEDLMAQVLTNLIDNAIKFSPPQSKIILRSREEEGFVRVEVEDFGPGIPRDQLPLMFRKFSRFLRPIHEPIKGSGLGLYLSKYFIELHGGAIRVKSIEGQGTTFSFTLPLQGLESETILG